MKNFKKILLGIGIIVLVWVILRIISVMYFPIYRIAPLNNTSDPITKATFVFTVKYFDENNLKEWDMLVYSGLEDIYGVDLIIQNYSKDFHEKYKDKVLWKVWYKIGE